MNGDAYAGTFDEKVDKPADEGNIPTDTMQVIRDGVEDDKLRASAFWNVLTVLKRRGLTVDRIIELLEAHPDGIAKKYRGRLRDEVERAYRKIESEAAPQSNASANLPIVHWHGEVDIRDSRPWAVQDLIPEVGCGLLSGQWGTYKTFTGFDLAHDVMSGEPFLGFAVVRRGGVLFIAAEGQSEVAIRLQGVIEDRGKIEGRAPFAWVETCPPLIGADAVAVLSKLAERATAKLKAEFDLPLTLIVIDTVVAAAGYAKEGADNDTATGQMLMRTLAGLSRNAGCFVLGIDHFGKDVNVGTRGTSAKEGAAEVVFAMLGEKTVTGEITNTRLALRKRRGGASGQEFPFQTRLIDMGSDQYGQPITTLVLDWSDTVAPQKAAKDNNWGRSKGVRLLRRIIMSMLVDQGVSLTPWADGPTVRALKLEAVKTEFLKSYYTEGETDAAKKRAKRVAFERAVRAAGSDEKGVIVTREIEAIEYVWLASARAEAEATTVAAKLRPQQAPAKLLATALAEWAKTIGVGETRSLDQVIKIAADHPSLKAALVAVAPMDDGQTISNVRLARWLRDFEEVAAGGLRLSGGGTEAGSPLWTLQACDDG